MYGPDTEAGVVFDAWVDSMASRGVLVHRECEGLTRVARALAEAYEWADVESFSACMRLVQTGIGMQVVRGMAKVRACPPEAGVDPAVLVADRQRAGVRAARRAPGERG